MGRRKGGSAAGTGLLVVLGLVFAALGALYKFVVENLAAIVVFGTIAGLLLVLWYFFSKLEGRKSAALERAVAVKQSQTQLPTERGYVEPQVQFGSRKKSAATPSKARWVLPTEKITVQGANIAGGTFYLGTALYFEGHEIDAYVVNPKLSSKSTKPDVDGVSMPYWPSYAEVSPAARRAFLKWMATGRQAKPYGIGHVFLYFYGLEHRVFADRDVAGTPSLIAEVERLLCVYGDNGSFRGYATHFLEYARCAAGLPLPVPEPSPDHLYSTEGPPVLLHLGRRLVQSATILSEDALIWVLALQDVYLRTAAVRCFDEFVPLWHVRFRSRFPEGLRIATSGNVDLTYRAASGAFEVSVDGPHRDYPDVTKVKTSLEPLRLLLQECTDELDGFSRLLGRRPEARNSVQAVLLLPEDLLAETGFEALREFGQRLSEIMGGKQLASTKMDIVLQLANFDLPESGKLSPAVADQLGQVLDRLDIAIEPDRRYGGGVPQPADQVFLFKAPRGGPVDPERPAYRSMKAQVEVAVLAAAADGEASGEEMQRVIAGIKAGADLGGVERADLVCRHDLQQSAEAGESAEAVVRADGCGAGSDRESRRGHRWRQRDRPARRSSVPGEAPQGLGTSEGAGLLRTAQGGPAVRRAGRHLARTATGWHTHSQGSASIQAGRRRAHPNRRRTPRACAAGNGRGLRTIGEHIRGRDGAGASRDACRFCCECISFRRVGPVPHRIGRTHRVEGRGPEAGVRGARPCDEAAGGGRPGAHQRLVFRPLR